MCQSGLDSVIILSHIGSWLAGRDLTLGSFSIPTHTDEAGPSKTFPADMSTAPQRNLIISHCYFTSFDQLAGQDCQTHVYKYLLNIKGGNIFGNMFRNINGAWSDLPATAAAAVVWSRYAHCICYFGTVVVHSGTVVALLRIACQNQPSLWWSNWWTHWL